jgi:hypothetical protein
LLLAERRLKTPIKERFVRINFCFLFNAAALLLGGGVFLSAQNASVLTSPTISKPVAVVITPPLRELAKQPQEIPFGFRHGEPIRYPKPPHLLRGRENDGRFTFQDSVAQNAPVPDSTPTKLMDWLGIGEGFFGYPVYVTPSDMNLSIGDNEIVQWGNDQFAVFDLQGNNLFVDGQAYVNGNILFAGLPNCGNRNDGDEVAQWDKVAHRWVMLEPVMATPARDCLAISQTPDALGAWYAYEFTVPNADTAISDYPKLGIWPDGFYVSHNEFHMSGSSPFIGTTPCAYERAKMLAGDPTAQQVCFVDSTSGSGPPWPESFDDNQLPSDLDSPNSLPPSGMPNVYMGSITNTETGYGSNVYYYKFHVDWANPTNSTFSCINGACAIPVAQFYLGSWLGLAPEPSGDQLATFGDRLMYRLAYRGLPSATIGKTVRDPGSMESWVVSHAVGNNGHLGVRWYEFRAPLGSTDPTVYQQGTFSPDATWRFMSSIAQDKMGNMAMSYTVTDSSVYPTIAFTGRGKTDPLGTMGAEEVVIAGTGSQIDSYNHWGDYYNMGISNDGCTFVTTGQYYTANASYHWSTRVVKLRFANCLP